MVCNISFVYTCSWSNSKSTVQIDCKIPGIISKTCEYM